MSKPFKSHDDLIALMKSRNILISSNTEELEVKSILARENYYSIINGYKEPFLDLQSSISLGYDQYLPGTTFFQIYHVFKFDRNLRALLLASLLQAEQNLATKVAYHFSQQYQSQFSHLNINNFSKVDLTLSTKLISILSSVTQRNAKSKNSPFYHYLTKHQDLPLWVLITKLTFGELIYFYKSVTLNLQDNILNELIAEHALEFNTTIPILQATNLKDFIDILDILVAYRNICAHGDRLYDYRLKIGRTIKKINPFFMTSPKGAESSIYGLLIILRLFMPREEYQILITSIIAQLDCISQKIPTPQFHLLLSKMELTLNWKQALQKLA